MSGESLTVEQLQAKLDFALRFIPKGDALEFHFEDGTSAPYGQDAEEEAKIIREYRQRESERRVKSVLGVRSKHSHYHKCVKGLDFIDVYRVLALFDVTDPCIQHAVKKLLVAGGRGAGKDISKDVQESIDSLERWKEMRLEEV